MHYDLNESRDQRLDRDAQKRQFHSVDVDISIISYAPQVFKFIRYVDGVDELQILTSVDPRNNRYQIFKTNKGYKHNKGGKSGSFFFFTQDRKYIIKTLFKQEKDKLMAMLPKMVKFVRAN